ncbi:MAG TPA: metal-dependent hydrolase [Methanosarcinales archaeon]|nr:metal-dependent hydrolase [Methanosarcinales archaeon]
MIPITDNHIHLDRRGKGIAAAKEFANAGGTHLILVSKPPWTVGVRVKEPDGFKPVFEETIDIAREINLSDIGVTVFTVLGVHPAEITRLTDQVGLKRAEELMIRGLEIAGRFVSENEAIAIKTGRPHYMVSDSIWDASNRIMAYGMELAREAGCAVQLHTETAETSVIADLAAIARKSGLPPEKVVKHYAPPMVQAFKREGIFPGVLAGKGAIETALSEGSRFMMETDYIDDPKRPGAVLGPKTVPRRTKQLIERFGEEVFWKVHKENPEQVYGIEITV